MTNVGNAAPSSGARDDTAWILEAISAYSRRGRNAALTAFLALIVCVGLLGAPASFGGLHAVMPWAVAFAGVTGLGGAMAVWRAKWMRVAAAIADVRTFRITVDPLANRRPGVLLLPDDQRALGEEVLVVSAFRWRLDPLLSARGTIRAGVGPGGRFLLAVRPPGVYAARRVRTSFWRARLRKWALSADGRSNTGSDAPSSSGA